VTDLEYVFPGLRSNAYAVTSPRADTYNCMAWAAGDDEAWWWPDEMETSYWPPEVPRVVAVDAFVRAYEGLGYERCATSELERGFERIALYVDSNGIPTHAARQLADGAWTSKLGRLEDITHTNLESISGGGYGLATVFMRRPREGEAGP
jgi:hypothetical protein